MKTLISILALVSVAFDGYGAFVVAPAPSGPINADTALPFLVTTDLTASVRFQQVYSGADFAGYGASQFLITELSFMPGSIAPIDVLLQDIEISFSTTPRVPDGLSSTFADNIGPDSQVVYSGSLLFRETLPFPWDLHIPLQEPFLYDWAAGNLLLDVRNFQTIGSGRPFDPPRVLDALGYAGDGGSSVSAFDVNSPGAESVSTVSLLTRFTVTPVPEPNSILLVLAGLIALVWMHSPRGCRRRKASFAEPSDRKGGFPCL